MSRRIPSVDSNYDFPNEIDILKLNRDSDMKIMGWKPQHRPDWVKAYMRMPGPMKAQLLLLAILTTSSVLSTGLLISRRGNNTSVGNILPSVESLEVATGSDGLRVRVTGNATMEVLQNFKPMFNALERQYSEEKSLASTEPKEK